MGWEESEGGRSLGCEGLVWEGSWVGGAKGGSVGFAFRAPLSGSSPEETGTEPEPQTSTSPSRCCCPSRQPAPAPALHAHLHPAPGSPLWPRPVSPAKLSQPPGFHGDRRLAQATGVPGGDPGLCWVLRGPAPCRLPRMGAQLGPARGWGAGPVGCGRAVRVCGAGGSESGRPFPAGRQGSRGSAMPHPAWPGPELPRHEVTQQRREARAEREGPPRWEPRSSPPCCAV